MKSISFVPFVTFIEKQKLTRTVMNSLTYSNYMYGRTCHGTLKKNIL